MSDSPFDASQIEPFDASQVEPLTFLGHIRKRPRMYVDPLSGDAVLGSALAGLLGQDTGGATTIVVDVVIESDGSASVADDGPGLPVTMIRGKTHAEMILGMALTPGHNRLAIANALSDWFIADVHTAGFQWRQRFEQGQPTTPFERVATTSQTFTRVRFLPSTELLTDGPIALDLHRRSIKDVMYAIRPGDDPPTKGTADIRLHDKRSRTSGEWTVARLLPGW